PEGTPARGEELLPPFQGGSCRCRFSGGDADAFTTGYSLSPLPGRDGNEPRREAIYLVRSPQAPTIRMHTRLSTTGPSSSTADDICRTTDRKQLIRAATVRERPAGRGSLL